MFANWSSLTNVSCSPRLIDGYCPFATLDERSPGRYWKFAMCTVVWCTNLASAGGFSGFSHGGPPYCVPHQSSVCLPHVRFGTPCVGSFQVRFHLPIMYGLQRPLGFSALSMYAPSCVITRYQAWSLFS